MSIPQLDSCCCGCTLKTGSKIIGWLSLIVSIMGVIVFGMVLTGLYYIEEHPDSEQAKSLLPHIPALKTLTIFLIIVYVAHCVMSVILLLGVYQSKAKLLLFWVLVSLTIAIITQLLNFAQMLVVYDASRLSTIISFLIELYFILVVYSLYREIRNVSGNYA